MDLLHRSILRKVPVFLLCIVSMAVFAITPAAAQELDSKGKEFWVTFMSNLGSVSSEVSTLRLYLSSDKPTVVTITYFGDASSRQVVLPTPNVPVEVNINTLFSGVNAELSDVRNSRANEISGRSFFVSADNEITLYGANIRNKSADAFLGLPTDVLTGRYVVLAYPNGYDFNSGTYDTPSEFAVIGTEDNTTVRINPSPGTTINFRDAGEGFSVKLDRGQVFFAQAGLGQEQDVSGSQVIADKPVAVYAGNKRTSIPTRIGNYRDHLVEQLPPLDAWGRGALVTPHFKVTPEAGDTAVIRILAAFAGTDVSVTDMVGTRSYVLGPGLSIELPLLEAMAIKASQPILVAQYEHSVGPNTFSDIGDPFMMLVPPAEQFDTAYTFQSILHREFQDYHFINVVIPAGGEASLRLDDLPVTTPFLPVPGTRYLYSQIPVRGGAHYIRGDSAFGLSVYGYGSATSYGYPGGMLFRTLVSDFQPPEIFWADECALIRGLVLDDKITDTGLDSVYATSDTVNVRLTVQPFESGQDTVMYSATLIDPYEDGRLTIKAVDRGGRTRTQTASIPGYTLRVLGTRNAPERLDTFVVFNAPSFCRQVSIQNYGAFEQEISKASILENMPLARIATDLPVTVKPGEVATIDICFEDMADTLFDLTLRIDGPCASRHVAIVPIDSRVDTTAPDVDLQGPPCGDEFLLSYSESYRASGIVAIEYDTLVNCTVEMLSDTSKMPLELLQLKLHRQDPRYDLMYSITLRDAAGNSRTDRDTIGGFTLAILSDSNSRDTLGARYARQWNGDMVAVNHRFCDSVLLANYGSRQMRIDRILMKGNRNYSIPPAQFPIYVEPGKTTMVAVCVEGWEIGMIADTMIIVDGCEHADELMMVTTVLAANGFGTDHCNNAIGITTYAPAKRNFLGMPVPNPASGTASVDVALSDHDIVDLEVFDASGHIMLPVLRAIDLPAGINRVSFDVSRLEQGAYFCRMKTARGEVFVEKLIVNR